MKKRFIWVTVLVFLIGAGYLTYHRVILPRYVASIILDEEKASWYVPNRYEKRLAKSRKRINSSMDSVLIITHRNRISLDQLLKAIDEVSEERAYEFLDEMNATTIVSTDQVFDIGKKYFKPDFDVELFRDVFVRKATVPLIKKGLMLASKQREDQDMSPETIRTVVKQLLIEKEKKFSELDKINSNITK